MNICMFVKSIYPYQNGGMEVHIRYLVDGLVKEGHRVTVISRGRFRTPRRFDLEKDFELWFVPVENYFVQSNELFERLHSEKPFDIVHSQSSYGFGFVKYSKLKVPIVTTFHGTAINEVKSSWNTRSVKGYLMALFFYLRDVVLNKDDNLLLNKADRIIVGCNSLKDDISRQHSISKDKISVVKNGEDVVKFRPDMDVREMESRYGIKEDTKVILNVGYMTGQKGQRQLIKVVPELLNYCPELKVIIVGDGPEYNSLVKLSKKLGVESSVIFTRGVETKDLPLFYNLADVFVFPTVRLEAGALVIIESLLCGTPVITTDLCANPEYVSDSKNGIIIKPHDSFGLTKSILHILGNKQVLDDYGYNARKLAVENFSVEKMTRDTINVYNKIR